MSVTVIELLGTNGVKFQNWSALNNRRDTVYKLTGIDVFDSYCTNIVLPHHYCL